MPKRTHYTFETDVLKLAFYDYRGPDTLEPYRDNAACRMGITRRGWEVPNVHHESRITLVFTTKRTPGASMCEVYELRYAGRIALLRHAPHLTASPYRTLYWWPMIVSGGE